MQGKVSMVMTCYNKAEYIGEMLDSVLAQNWDNIELILVNDGSTDGTRDVIEEYIPTIKGRGFELVIVDQENAGVCAAAKAGLERVTGDYVCCVDADDELSPRYVSTMAGWLEENGDCDFCICNSKHFIVEEGQKKWLPLHIEMPPENTENIIYEWIFGEYECAVWRYMIRRDYFDKCEIVKNFFIDTRWSHEPFIAVPLLAYQGKYTCIDMPLYYFREVDESHSRSQSNEYRLKYRENYSNLILIAVDSLDPQFADSGRKLKMRAFVEFERKMQELAITRKIHDNECFRSLKDFFETSHLLNCLIERAIKYEKEEFLIPAMKDYLLGRKFYNRIIEYPATSLYSNWFVRYNEEDAAELWDEQSDEEKLMKPDFNSLNADDLILILPGIENDAVFEDVTSRVKQGQVVAPKDTEERYNLQIYFPELYLRRYCKCIMIKVEKVKVSLIVPVYDVSEYLRRCLDSCVYQTFQEIEIIVVNDGSPDQRDEEIMREYAQRFPEKVRLIFNSNNLGLGTTRNTGIKAAVGEFIQFVDSDDYIDLSMCEKLYNKAKSENADMVICDVNCMENGILRQDWQKYNVPLLSNKLGRLRQGGIHSSWRLAIKQTILTDNKLYYPEHIVFEDYLCCLWHIAANKIAYLEEPLYYYVQRIGSICNPTDAYTKYLLHKDVLKCIRYILNTNYFATLSDDLKSTVFVYLSKTYLLKYFRFLSNNHPELLKEWCEELLQIIRIQYVESNDGIFNRNHEALTIKYLIKFIDENMDSLNFPEKASEFSLHFIDDKMAERLCELNGKRIVIWGAGRRGKRLAGYLKFLSIPFEITDKNSELWGTKAGDETVTPWEALEKNTDVVIVSALNIYNSVLAEIDNPRISVLDFKKMAVLNSKSKVSIIIPVYNGVEFLRRCFDSCIYQTLDEIEVIAVNDCSPDDRDAEIMREYEKMYPGKFRCIFHKENTCQGGARNTGIREANGRYILCVDQDDFIQSEMCEEMYAKATEKDLDIVMCGYNVCDHGKITYYEPLIYTEEKLPRNTPTVWRLLVRKEFIIDNGAFFPKKVVTDDMVSILWFMLTDKFCTINKPFYTWMRHSNAESAMVTYRYCYSVPHTLKEICRYDAYQTLPDDKKRVFGVMASHHLYYSVVNCEKRHLDKIIELCYLVKDVLGVLQIDFTHEAFHNNYSGKVVAETLNFILENLEDEDFSTAICSLHKDIFIRRFLEQLRSVISAQTADDAPIVIWGAGKRGKYLADILNHGEIPFEITDSNTMLWGKKICGKLVRPWSELRDVANTVIFSPLQGYENVESVLREDCILLLNFSELQKGCYSHDQ